MQTIDDILSSSAIPLPSATFAGEQTNLPVIIAASAGGLILLLLCLLIVTLCIRRKSKREKVLLRGLSPRIISGGAIGDIPIRYSSNIMTIVEGSRPSLSKPSRLPSPTPRSISPLEGAASTPSRPTAIHEGYPSLYTESVLERACEILERNTTSPIPSFISGFTDGAWSRVASARQSSELNHGLSFPNAKVLFPPSVDALNSEHPGTSGSMWSRPGTSGSTWSRSGTSGSTRSRPGTSRSTRSRHRFGGEQIVSVVRRPSEVRRTELLTALWSQETVAVVGRPSLPSRPTTASRFSTVGELQHPEIDTSNHEITDQDTTDAYDRFTSLSEKNV